MIYGRCFSRKQPGDKAGFELRTVAAKRAAQKFAGTSARFVDIRHGDDVARGLAALVLEVDDLVAFVFETCQ